jgi:hypothetical protein
MNLAMGARDGGHEAIDLTQDRTSRNRFKKLEGQNGESLRAADNRKQGGSWHIIGHVRELTMYGGRRGGG